jgi:hypothetical protein
LKGYLCHKRSTGRRDDVGVDLERGDIRASRPKISFCPSVKVIFIGVLLDMRTAIYSS